MPVVSSVFNEPTNTEGSQSLNAEYVNDLYIIRNTTSPASAAARPLKRRRTARGYSDDMNEIMELLKIQVAQEHERHEEGRRENAERQRLSMKKTK